MASNFPGFILILRFVIRTFVVRLTIQPLWSSHSYFSTHSTLHFSDMYLYSIRTLHIFLTCIFTLSVHYISTPYMVHFSYQYLYFQFTIHSALFWHVSDIIHFLITMSIHSVHCTLFWTVSIHYQYTVCCALFCHASVYCIPYIILISICTHH